MYLALVNESVTGETNRLVSYASARNSGKTRGYGPCTRRDAITESRQPNFLRALPVSKGLQNEGESFLSAVYGAPRCQKMI